MWIKNLNHNTKTVDQIIQQKKTLCQFHKNCKEQKFKNTMFYIIHYKLLKFLLKILSTVFIE